jgi:ketosteroid isomerase-like protein
MKIHHLLLAFCCLLLPLRAAEDPVHIELRAVRDGLLAAANAGDIEGQLRFLHPNCVVTWHNAEVSRGPDGVRKYLERTLHGSPKIVEKFGAEVAVDELSIIYGGDTAIAFGSAQEHFTMLGGQHLDLHGRWTATLVKEGDKWLIASLHTSDNIFDNPLLNAAKKGLRWAGGAGVVVGVLAGLLLGMMVTRRFRRA